MSRIKELGMQMTDPNPQGGNLLDRQEDSKSLPDVVIEAKIPDCINENLIHLTQHFKLVTFCHIPKHPHSQTRSCQDYSML